MRSPEIRVYSDISDLNQEVAADIIKQSQDAVSRHGRFALVLSGGQTPKSVYEILGTRYKTEPVWKYIHIFWGDERYVPSDHPMSNFNMVHKSLLEHIPLPSENIHLIRTTEKTPQKAAEIYEHELIACFKENIPKFDLILLGLGNDGHTASLFPDSPALHEKDRLAVAVDEPQKGDARITMTYPVFNNAKLVYFIVAGRNKADAVRQAMLPDNGYLSCPARGIRLIKGKVIWWLDEESAALIPKENIMVR